MQHKPQKRHKALQPLSREHHHGLLLSWKIRSGFSKAIDPKRMRIYANWFFENHLISHFEMEETHIFPVLDSENELVKRALADHRRIKRLFNEHDDDTKTLSRIEEALEIYRWFLPLLELDISPQLVQNIKMAEVATGIGTEIVRAPRLPLIGKERERVAAVIKAGMASRPTLPVYKGIN